MIYCMCSPHKKDSRYYHLFVARVQPHWLVEVSLLGWGVHAHLAAVPLPQVAELAAAHGFARDEELGVDGVQVPLDQSELSTAC